MSLDGRVAVITGASRGLGRAIALALGRAGAKLALVSRDAEQLSAVAKEARELGAVAEVFRADISDEAQILQLAHDVPSKLGPADILVNNAGMVVRKTCLDLSLEEWNTVLNTNLTSAFLMSRSFVPQMKGRGYGRVINIGSIFGHVSLPMRTAYSASKAGLLGFTRALALELAEEKITVVTISPGPFITEMTAPLAADPVHSAQFTTRVPLARWGKPEEVGKLARYLCSEEASFITGTDILIDGGWCTQ
ncbi:MAG TPA: SDR family NAD(P)-dependent oxidoreductase [Bryobacteraceae bacterium]|nr:SDR family NAD(P)-dependent oxidoreductase [Bryobacteraceae bacterium]